MTKDCRKKGIDSGYITPKEDLEKYKNLTNPEISKRLGYSVYIVKKSLVHHNMYKGKVYEIQCEACDDIFRSFTKSPKFCSNHCKHERQKIWNRVLTKVNSSILNKISQSMIGNKRGQNVNHFEKNIKEIRLENLGTVSYDSKSNLEKEWLLSLDKTNGVESVSRPDFSIKYKTNTGKTLDYYPDFIVKWQTGVPWLVEVKGMLKEKDYEKIEYARKWCEENGFDYRVLTTGLIKKDTWDRVYSEFQFKDIPSREKVMMSHAVTWATLSPSFRLGVGCIISDYNMENILAFGYNGDEKGGTNVGLAHGPGGEGFIHAEENAIIKLKTDNNCRMFVTHMPCVNCAKRIINNGKIKEVFYIVPYRDTSGIGLLIKNGIKVFHFQMQDSLGNKYHDNKCLEFLIPNGMHKNNLLSGVLKQCL